MADEGGVGGPELNQAAVMLHVTYTPTVKFNVFVVVGPECQNAGSGNPVTPSLKMK